MTLEEMAALFEKHSDTEYIQFKRITVATESRRPDLCAFIRLDELVPGNTDIVSDAEHDEIYLEVEPEDLAKVVTEEDIIFLLRCGVRYDSSYPALCMFV